MKTCAECKWFALLDLRGCDVNPQTVHDRCKKDRACSLFEPIVKPAPGDILEPLTWLILESNNRCLWLTNNFDLGCKNPSYPFDDVIKLNPDGSNTGYNAGHNSCRWSLCPNRADAAYCANVVRVTDDKEPA